MITPAITSPTADSGWPQAAGLDVGALGGGQGQPYRKYLRPAAPPAPKEGQAVPGRSGEEGGKRAGQGLADLFAQAAAIRESDRASLFAGVGFLAQALAQNGGNGPSEPSPALKNSQFTAYREAQNLVRETSDERVELLDTTINLHGGPVVDIVA